jgi:hypothetical protein
MNYKKRLVYILFLMPTLVSATQIKIDLTKETGFKNGYYLAPEYGGEGRYALISHSHGAFEGGDIAQAECTNGYVVSKLPSQFNYIKKVLLPKDYVLTQCKENY